MFIHTSEGVLSKYLIKRAQKIKSALSSSMSGVQQDSYPRIVISGLSGDSGKTVVAAGLLAYFRDRGKNCAGFKKGPDYLDTAWLSLASGKPARNLDTYLMGFQKVKRSFLKNATGNDINVIEGNRGLFDGTDSKGTHSTAELARLLQSPIVIVQNISKVTRTAAASILGCVRLDPGLHIAGVILNRVAGERHGRVAKDSIEDATGIPVLGSIPKLPEKYILPSRHLGLISPDEVKERSVIFQGLKRVIEDNVDVQKIAEISRTVSLFRVDGSEIQEPEPDHVTDIVTIGYFRDISFSFYYPENLEMLAAAGAELVPISPQSDSDLSHLDGLYIGGGFPETNPGDLSLNRDLILSLRRLTEEGLPVYAECGGLMYLAEDIRTGGTEYTLSGILPVRIEMEEKPQAHGYCEAVVEYENPFFDVGTVIRGHEFHYSRIHYHSPGIKSALFVSRGTGCFDKRDGLTYKNVFATYIHVHSLATPEWAKGIVRCARKYKNFKKSKTLIER